MAATSDMFDNIRAYIEGTGRFFSQREKTPVLWQLEQLRAENEQLRRVVDAYSGLDLGLIYLALMTYRQHGDTTSLNAAAANHELRKLDALVTGKSESPAQGG